MTPLRIRLVVAGFIIGYLLGMILINLVAR